MLTHQHIHRLQLLLNHLGCDAILISDQVNLFYLTGMDLSAGKMLVHQHGVYLLVDARYYEICQKKATIPVLPLEKKPLKELLARPELSYIRSLGFDTELLSYKAFLDLQDQFKHSNLTLMPLNSPLKELRSIKDEEEIAILRQAAILGSEGFDYVCSLLKQHVTELELAQQLEIFWKQRGSKGLAFEPIIAFGANSSMPHYRSGNTRLENNQAVLIDIGVNLKHYHSDMTRVVYFGKPPEEIEKIFAIVQEAQRRALEKCKPGITVGELDATARDYITEKGYGEQFSHSLGHGIGLEVHEYPTLRNKPPLQEVVIKSGMVITIEPGIYLGGIGGVRLEDTVVITDKGHENLTKRPIKPYHYYRA